MDFKRFPSWYLFLLILLEKYFFESSFPTAILPVGDHTRFVREGFNRTSIVSVFDWSGRLAHTFGRLFSGTRSKSGACDMCTCVQADTASLASPAMPRSLDILYPGFFPAVTCEADGPCSVNIGLYPPSHLTLFSSARLSPCMCVEMFREL